MPFCFATRYLLWQEKFTYPFNTYLSYRYCIQSDTIINTGCSLSELPPFNPDNKMKNVHIFYKRVLGQFFGDNWKLLMLFLGFLDSRRSPFDKQQPVLPKEWTGKTIYLNFSSIFGDFFWNFLKKRWVIIWADLIPMFYMSVLIITLKISTRGTVCKGAPKL